MAKSRKISLLKMYQSRRKKVAFVKGWSSLNEYLTSRLTFNVKVILENRLTYRKCMTHIKTIIKLNVDSFFRIYSFEYKSAKYPEELGNENNDRIYDIFDIIFKDKDNVFHHFSIRGLEREKALLVKTETIFYDSSDDDTTARTCAPTFESPNQSAVVFQPRSANVWEEDSDPNNVNESFFTNEN